MNPTTKVPDRLTRSSWLASATNWRTRSSEGCLASRALSTFPSMWLNAAPACPISVLGSVSVTRSPRLTSPRSRGSCATRVAAAAIRSSGRSDRRTTRAAAVAAASRPSAVGLWVRGGAVSLRGFQSSSLGAWSP